MPSECLRLLYSVPVSEPAGALITPIPLWGLSVRLPCILFSSGVSHKTTGTAHLDKEQQGRSVASLIQWSQSPYWELSDKWVVNKMQVLFKNST